MLLPPWTPFQLPHFFSVGFVDCIKYQHTLRLIFLVFGYLIPPAPPTVGLHTVVE